MLNFSNQANIYVYTEVTETAASRVSERGSKVKAILFDLDRHDMLHLREGEITIMHIDLPQDLIERVQQRVAVLSGANEADVIRN